MEIPFLDLKLQYKQIEQEVLPTIKRAMENGMFIGGEQVKNLKLNLEQKKKSKKHLKLPRKQF